MEGRLFGRKTNFWAYFWKEDFILVWDTYFRRLIFGFVMDQWGWQLWCLTSRLGFLIKIQKGWNFLTKFWYLIFLNAIIVGKFYLNLVVYKSGDHEITYLDPRWRGWTSSSVLVMYCRIKMIVNLIWKCYSC